MSKYDIDKSFGIARKFKFHLNKTLVSFANVVLKNTSKCLKKDKDITLSVEKINVDNGTILIYVITPNSLTSSAPCLLYIHGGGFVFDIQSHQFKNMTYYAKKTNSIVVAPRYRLSPKHSSPTLLNDCLSSYKWMIENSKKLNINIDKIGIGGDSTGGFLATKLVSQLIDKGNNILYQLLVYPVIDNKMRTTSMKKFKNTPMWNSKNNKIMWKWYYKNQDEISLLDDNLSNKIPNTYIETTEFDCLHDEGILYANKLKSLGINVEINETKKTMHGFDIVDCDITKSVLNKRVEFINNQLK